MSDSPLRRRIDTALTAVDELASWGARSAVTWGALSVLIGLALGGSVRGFLTKTGVPTDGVFTQAVWTTGGVFVVFAALLLTARLRLGSVRLSAIAEAAAWFNPRLSWVIAVYLFQGIAGSLERSQPLLVLTYVSLAALAVGYGVFQIKRQRLSRTAEALVTEPSSEAPEQGGTSPWSKWWPSAVLGAMFVAYAIAMTVLSWNNLWGFNMGRSDMGYYVSIFRHSSLGDPLGMSLAASGNHLGGHFDPILVVLSPLYLIYPHAETLLLLQALWLSSGIFPLYRLARHYGCDAVGAVILAACYAMYPALHGINLFDFHSLALAVPVIMWVLLFFEQGRRVPFFVAFAILLSVREDMALISCFIGLYALISGKDHGKRWGWVVIVTSLAYLFVVKGFIMSRGDLLMASEHSTVGGGGKAARAKPSGYTRFFAELIPAGGNVKSLIATIIGQPLHTLSVMLKENKLTYVLLILAPLSFLPLFAKRRRVLLVYGFLFTLLASRPHLHSVHFQYSSVLVPFTLPLTAAVLGGLRTHGVSWIPFDRRKLYAALVGITLVMSAGASWKFGGLIPNRSFKGGFRGLDRSPSTKQKETAAWLKTICPKLPEDVVVAANSRILPHLGNCSKIILAEQRKKADYLVFGPTTEPLRSRVRRDIDRGYLTKVDEFHDLRLFEVDYDKPAKRPTAKRKASKSNKSKKSTKSDKNKRKKPPKKPKTAPRDKSPKESEQKAE